MKFIKTLFAIFVAIAATILMAFYYDKIGSVITLVIVIGAVFLLVPKLLRKNFGTDKLNYIDKVHKSQLELYFATPNKDGLYPCKKFNSFCIFSNKSAKKQLRSKVYYIDLKAQILLFLIGALGGVFFLFVFFYIWQTLQKYNFLISILFLIIFLILSIKFIDMAGNFIIKKFAKNYP